VFLLEEEGSFKAPAESSPLYTSVICLCNKGCISHLHSLERRRHHKIV